jgi:predicted nucleic acid-binding protein
VIVVDTSVWVEALRRGESEAAAHLRDLLDADEVALAAPVRVEILTGASKRDRAVLRRVLSALPVLLPDDATWARIDGWIDRTGDRGERFGFADLLIASLAADRDDALWSLDGDFRRMARLGLVRLHDRVSWRPV